MRQSMARALAAIGHDLIHAARALTRRGWQAVAPVLVLGAGVGGAVAMLVLVDRLMFRPPAHVQQPERIVRVPNASNYVTHSRLRDRSQTLELAAYTRVVLSFGSGEEALPLQTQCVTDSYFEILGVRPVAGDTIRPGVAAGATVVLSDAFRRRVFGAGSEVIGRTIPIAGRAYTVAGVVPAAFRGVDMELIDAWTLLTGAPELCSFTGQNLLADDSGSWLRSIARLRAGHTRAQAEAELRTIASRESEAPTVPIVLRSIHESKQVNLARENRVALWLLGAAGVLLLIACANVAGLLSVRAVDRRPEIAIRLQLGASRRRVMGMLIMESVLLAGACVAVAALASLWVTAVVARYFAPGTVDGIVTAANAGLLAAFGVLASVSSAIVPALQAVRAGAGASSRTGRTIGAERSWFRNALIVGQVALALVLAIGAGLFSRSLQRAQSEIGYDVDRVIVATIDLSRAGSYGEQDVTAAFERIQSRVSRVPGVESVSLTSGSILGSGGGPATMMALRASAGAMPTGFHVVQAVTPQYFSTVGRRLLRGRAFGPADDARSSPVMILDADLANELWPGEDAVGRCAMLAGRSVCIAVIGLTVPTGRGYSEFFLPLSQIEAHGATELVPRTVLLRASRSVDAALPAAATAIRQAVPHLPFVNIRPLLDLADVRLQSWRLGSRMFGLFGGAALALAAVGMYAVIAYGARRRTSEIGLRMALGAPRRQILTLIARRGLLLVASGWMLGTLVSMAVTRFVQHLLFDVDPGDVATFATASAVILAVGAGASLIPAVRASRVDPSIALRYD